MLHGAGLVTASAGRRTPQGIVALLLLVGSLAAAPGSPRAAAYLVRPDGTGDHPTIQAALDAAANGDLIVLADGTYQGPGNRDLDCLGKAVTILSQSGRPSGCRIDCQGSAQDPHRAFYVHQGEDTTTVVRGLTILHGYAVIRGGAICCTAASRLLLIHCRIDDCHAFQGGALSADAGAGLFARDCELTDNRALDAGGALWGADSARLEIRECRLDENAADGFGGALYAAGGTQLRITDSRIHSNVAQEAGGAISSEESDLALLRCTLSENESATTGGALALTGGRATIAECVVRECQALHSGGALHAIAVDTLRISGSTLVANRADQDGGALALEGPTVTTVTHCTLHGNQAPVASGVHATGGGQISLDHSILAFGVGGAAVAAPEQASLTLTHCDLYGNQGGDWNGEIGDQLGQAGNLWADPLFCAPETFDLTLCELSPCAPDSAGAGERGEPIGAWPVGCGAIRLAADGSGDYATLAAALEAAPDGAILALAPGIYRGAGNRELDPGLKRVRLAGLGWPDSACVIDCEHAGRAFRFDDYPAGGSELTGLTILGGEAEEGGAIYCDNVDLTLRVCTLAYNRATRGGALYATGWRVPSLENCTLVGNEATAGAGLVAAGDHAVTLRRTIIAASPAGEAVSCETPAGAALSCCDLFGNAGGDWIGPIASQAGQAGNLSADPEFCSESGFDGCWPLRSFSPCRREQAPACGLIGAWALGCPSTVTVNPDGSGDYPTIQAALDAVAAGDTVTLGPGVFYGAGNRELDLHGQAIVLRSHGGDPTQCTIDCEHAGRGFYLHSGEPSATRLEGITITHGFTDGQGGGIACASAAAPTIVRCILAHCVAATGGGIAATGGAAPRIEQCTLYGNQAEAGSAYSGDHGVLCRSILAAGSAPPIEGSPTLTCCNLYGNLGGDWTAEIAGQFGQNGNIAEDPLFCVPGHDRWTINAESPCVAFTPPNTECDALGALGVGCATHRLRADGSGDQATIQAAVDVAADGDRILLEDGIYSGAGNRDIDFHGRALRIRPETAQDTCVIYCASAGRGFHFHSGEDSTAVLERLAITDGAAARGAGVYCAGAAPRLIDCLLAGNVATEAGGGLSCDACPPIVLESCRVRENEAPDGAGLAFAATPFALVATTLHGNQASDSGGGVSATGCPVAELEGCTFTANEAAQGAGIALSETPFSLGEITFQENLASLAGGGLHAQACSTATLQSCTFRENRAPAGAALALVGTPFEISVATLFRNVATLSGGGLYAEDCGPGLLRSCTLRENAAPTGGGIALAGTSRVQCQLTLIAFGPEGEALASDPSAWPVLYTCDLWGNAGGDWTENIAAQLPVQNNLSADPRFCGPEDHTYDDYSPCLPGHPTHPGTEGIGAWGMGCTASCLLVRADGGGDFPTLQAALDAAESGVLIELDAGTFRGPGNRDLDFHGRAHTLRAASRTPGACILDCAGAGRAFHFHTGEDSLARVEGLTITGGFANGNGGAIRCAGAAPRFVDCVIESCRATGRGGGLFASAGAPELHDCRLSGNQADSLGGGCHAEENAHLRLLRCTLAENQAGVRGGGLDLYRNGEADLSECTLVGNEAPLGSGLACRRYSAAVLTRTILAFGGPGAAVSLEMFSTASLACCDLYGNAGGDWTGNLSELLGQEGNICRDPIFRDPAAGDFSLGLDSPCAPFSPPNVSCDRIGAWPQECHSYLLAADGSGDFPTVQEAIDAAGDCDQILLAPGLYEGPGNRAIELRGKAVVIAAPGGGVGDVTLDGGAVESVFRAVSGEGPDTRLEGLTIRNGQAAFGGGIACLGSSPTIVRCTLTGNTATEDGGAIAAGEGAAPHVTGCTLVANEAPGGAGIACRDSSAVTVEGTIIAFSPLGAAASSATDSALTCTCCDFYGNAGGDWSGSLAGQLAGDGNFSADPLFCGDSVPSAPYLLRTDSPCRPGAPEHPECGLIGAWAVGCSVTVAIVPGDLFLDAARPTPGRGPLTLRYGIPEAPAAGPVAVAILDAAGRCVCRLREIPAVPGVHTIAWDGRDASGLPVPSGIYFLRLQCGPRQRTRRLILLH